MAVGKTIFFKKLVDGGVSLNLQDVEGVLPSRWFSMDQKMPRIGVPENYALTIFLDSSLDKMLKRNYFEVEDMPALVKIAQTRGYIAPSEEEVGVLVAPKRTKEILLSILKGGNEEKIRELFSSVDKTRALEIAIANAKSMSIEVVQKIEDILGMAITED